ncbi:MAG: amidase [Rhodospirillales bacterium]|jgi:amidase|nr:amidase [Rhodospirillales bacterium]MDP6772877.1 amidase [Rhodospirillales bacterium]
MQDDFGAFCRHAEVNVPGAPEGPLAGLTFGAKDLFDVAGFVTGAGSPEWLRTHGEAETTAPAVQALIDAGAELVGKTAVDELAFSITGVNPHYGTPVNPRCPDRLPGGSSSGSGVAAAAGLVDFTLGSDTAGSVRIPASYNGVFGIRPTHGRLPLEGVVALSPSFDAAGWLARDAALLDDIGQVYFTDAPGAWGPFDMVIVEDAFAQALPAAGAALAPALERLSGLASSVERAVLAPQGLQAWFEAFRTIEFAEAWATHATWIGQAGPALKPDIRGRFEEGSRITADEVAAATAARRAIVDRLEGVVGGGGVLVLPTAPGAAPPKDAPAAELQDRRERTMRITCIAGLGGLPEISIPAATVEGCPLGLSIAAARGSDSRLLSLARRLAPEIVAVG